MSVDCCVAYPGLLLKALTALTIAKESWATLTFTDTVVMLHVEGADQSITATATLPKSLFSEYIVSDARFAVHLASLCDALLIGGQDLLSSVSLAHIVLRYPVGDASLLVELADGDRTLQSTLVTQPVKNRLLNLRFTDVPVVNQVTLPGDVARDIIEDLVAVQCRHADVLLDARDGMVLRGEGEGRVTVTLQLQRHSDVILSGLCEEKRAHTRVLTSHLGIACGGRPSGKFSRSTGVSSEVSMGVLGGFTGGSASMPLLGGFERILLQVNDEHQLNVVHMPREHDIPVSVSVVVAPLCDLESF